MLGRLIGLVPPWVWLVAVVGSFTAGWQVSTDHWKAEMSDAIQEAAKEKLEAVNRAIRQQNEVSAAVSEIDEAVIEELRIERDVALERVRRVSNYEQKQCGDAVGTVVIDDGWVREYAASVRRRGSAGGEAAGQPQSALPGAVAGGVPGTGESGGGAAGERAQHGTQ